MVIYSVRTVNWLESLFATVTVQFYLTCFCLMRNDSHLFEKVTFLCFCYYYYYYRSVASLLWSIFVEQLFDLDFCPVKSIVL